MPGYGRLAVGGAEYVTFIGDRWIRGIDPTSTYDPYSAGIRRRVLPTLGHFPVGMITAGLVHRAIDQWETEFGRSTIKNTVSALVLVLNEAVVTVVLALAGFVTAGVLPAAATASTVPYVALGDSYAAGQGAPPYVDDACKQSRDQSYPALLDRAESRIELTANAACSGAKTSEVADQVDDQLSALYRARLVTLTVGAANLGLSAVLAACLPTSDQCAIEIARAQSVLGDCPGGKSQFGDSLTALYAQVAGKARGARIVVTGYPLLFEPPDPNAPNAGIITVINQATTELNCVIERAVAATQATYANIHYVDVTEEFARHGIGCTAPCTLFINPPLSAPPSAEAFHPTPDGYGAYAKAIKTKLPDGWLDKPST